MARFPFVFRVKQGKHDQPPGPDKVGVFEQAGYWASLRGQTFSLPVSPENAALVETVTIMLNAAYEQGKDDKQAEIRSALGLENDGK